MLFLVNQVYKLRDVQPFENKENKENKDYIRFYGRRKLQYLHNFYHENYKASIRKLESKRNKYRNSFMLFILFLLIECVLMCLLMVKTIYNTLPLRLMTYLAIFYVGFFLFFNITNFLFFFIDFNFENKARNDVNPDLFTIKDSQNYYNSMYTKTDKLLNDFDNIIEDEKNKVIFDFEENEKKSKEIVMEYYHKLNILRVVCDITLSIIFLFFIVKI